MPFNNSKPNIIAAEAIRTLDKTLVAKAITNNYYQGLVSYGKSVTIPGIGTVNVGSYTGADITWQTGQDSATIMPIDQQDYIAVKIDDVDEVQTPYSILQAYGQQAAYNIAENADSYVLGLVTNAGIKGGSGDSALGTTTTPIEITADGGAGQKGGTMLERIATRMDEANVPRAGRWVVVPPWYRSKLVLEKVLTSGSLDANMQWQNGLIDNVYGFRIYVSNNVKVTSTTKYHVMAGVEMSITMANQIEKMKMVDFENSFGVGIKGLHVYGAKVARPDTTVESVVTRGTEGQ